MLHSGWKVFHVFKCILLQKVLCMKSDWFLTQYTWIWTKHWWVNRFRRSIHWFKTCPHISIWADTVWSSQRNPSKLGHKEVCERPTFGPSADLKCQQFPLSGTTAFFPPNSRLSFGSICKNKRGGCNCYTLLNEYVCFCHNGTK